MTGSELERQIERGRRRLERLRDRAEGAHAGPVLQEAVEELGQTLEELSVVTEELAASNEELAEAQLAAEEHARRYQELFRDAPDAYVVTDERGVIVELNQMAEQKLGRPGRLLAGKPLLTLVAPADRDTFLDCLSALRARRARLEDRLIRFGSPPGLEASVSALPEARERGVEVRWLLRDVTERRRVEAALRASEARMRSLAHSLRVPISYVDRDERYQFNNAAYEEWFDIPREKLVGMPVRELLGEAAYRRVRHHIEAVLAGKPQVFEEELPYAWGGTRNVIVEYEPAVGEDGEVAGFYALVTDVTAATRAERKAREAEVRVRAVLDAALDGILGSDEAGVIRSVNPALCRMFGYEADELLGRPVTTILKLPFHRRGHLALAPLVGSVRELVGVRRDGPRLPLQVSVGEARTQEGWTFVATLRDLTGQKTLESQLQGAAAAAALAEDRERRRLAGDLHDDVSQLLTLAGVKLGLLRSGVADRELEAGMREIGEVVARAHERTESLTFQLSPPILHELGLVAAAEWLGEEMERSYGLRVHVELGREPRLDEAVRITLFRALRELLINVARHARTEQAWVRLGQENGSVRMVVEDRGVGFDPNIEPRGFGLFSIRERLKHLEGRLEIEAVPGDGTRVTLVAPLAAGAVGPDPGL